LARTNNRSILSPTFKDIVDNLGRYYMILLFISGAVWAFVAVNSFDAPDLFKIALIYALLLIFGFFGVSLDRRPAEFGINSRIWEGAKLKSQLAIGAIFFIGWYLLFMTSGFSVATAQSVGSTALFAVNPTINFILLTVLGPLAENIFFFGVLNITLITLLQKIVKSRTQSLVFAGLTGLSYFMFENVPNAIVLVGAAAGITALAGLTQHQFLLKHAPFVVSAFIIGALVFPRFHSYAYQLNQKNYIAASWFGFFMCLLAGYIGMMPVDIAHILNNIIAVGG